MLVIFDIGVQARKVKAIGQVVLVDLAKVFVPAGGHKLVMKSIVSQLFTREICFRHCMYRRCVLAGLNYLAHSYTVVKERWLYECTKILEIPVIYVGRCLSIRCIVITGYEVLIIWSVVFLTLPFPVSVLSVSCPTLPILAPDHRRDKIRLSSDLELSMLTCADRLVEEDRRR